MKYRHRIVRNVAYAVMYPYTRIKYGIEIERFRAQGLLEGAGRRVCLTPRGMDVMNAILEEFLP